MALFATHLFHIVISSLYIANPGPPSSGMDLGIHLVVGFHQMFNVIIRPVLFYSSVLLIRFTWLLGHRTNNNYGEVC